MMLVDILKLIPNNCRLSIVHCQLMLCALLLTLPLAACNSAKEVSGAPQAPFPTNITLTRVAGGFVHPVTVAHAGDGSGRLFVVEQRGTIKVLRHGRVTPTPFLDIKRL